MRASRGAAVGVVAEGVHVHAALGVGVVARDVPRHGRVGGLGRLLEGDGALNVGVTAEDSHCGYILAFVLSHLVPHKREGKGKGRVGGRGWDGSDEGILMGGHWTMQCAGM